MSELLPPGGDIGPDRLSLRATEALAIALDELADALDTDAQTNWFDNVAAWTRAAPRTNGWHRRMARVEQLRMAATVLRCVAEARRAADLA